MRIIKMLNWVCFILFVFATSSGNLSSAMLDPLDFLVLQSIRKSLNDLPGSSFFSNWDFTSDPCAFPGVYCVNGKVLTLNLGDGRAGSPGLIGRLDPAIGKLTNLAEFSLVPGKVMGSIPSSLSLCKNLRFLGISRNYISGTIPASLGMLRSLQTLDLSNNLLTGPIPYSVGSLPRLVNVILCRNRLSGSIPPFVSPTLTRFDAKHNFLSGSLFAYSLPPSLRYLSLSANRLTGPAATLLIRLNRLNYLDLSMNRFTGQIPPRIFSFPMTSLQLQRNWFSGPVRPAAPVTISNVDLSYNQLSGEISPMFSTVRTLYLNNNKFSGQVPACFVERLLAASIKILYLQHNYLSGIEISPTAEIPVSSSLCLQYNCMVPPVQMTCPMRAGLQRTRPPSQCR
uniref:Leucine-rich repeat-containing N-terminal plant-type domain-containing protein n=1 Tax=Kalanchoe fedtschenkoi TaxID=63787 RepID=A0A7N0T400_KALFE